MSLATGSDVYWNLPTVPGPAQAVLTLSQTTIPEPTSRQNEIRLDQQGGGSRAMLSVVNGLQNRVELVQQNGSGAYATVSGSNNSLIVTQTGGGNQLGLGLTGHGNRLSISQDGGDRVELQGLVRDNSRLELVQKSGNNTFITDNTTLFNGPLTTGIPNLKIEQSGGATIHIQNGHAFNN